MAALGLAGAFCLSACGKPVPIPSVATLVSRAIHLWVSSATLGTSSMAIAPAIFLPLAGVRA